MLRVLIVLQMAMSSASCWGGEGTSPANVSLVGTYVAEGAVGTFTTLEGSGGPAVDWLARGASIRLVLNDDMTTEGRLFVPGADEGGGSIDADLRGTWTLSADEIVLAHEADTFLRDMPLRIHPGQLVGQKTWSRTLRVELVRR